MYVFWPKIQLFYAVLVSKGHFLSQPILRFSLFERQKHGRLQLVITKHDAMECTAMALSHPTMTDIVARNNMEDLRVAEERAVIADTALGADILRANLQQDDNRRSQFAAI